MAVQLNYNSIFFEALLTMRSEQWCPMLICWRSWLKHLWAGNGGDLQKEQKRLKKLSLKFVSQNHWQKVTRKAYAPPLSTLLREIIVAKSCKKEESRNYHFGRCGKAWTSLTISHMLTCSHSHEQLKPTVYQLEHSDSRRKNEACDSSKPRETGSKQRRT